MSRDDRSVDRFEDPYARRRAEQRQRREREERHEVAPPEADDWTAPTEDGDRVRRVRSPEELGDLLPDLVRDRGWGDRLEASTVVARWEDIAGPELARRCEPIRIAGGTLVVQAVDQTWATQLKYMTSHLVERTNEVVGRELVREVRITVGRNR